MKDVAYKAGLKSSPHYVENSMGKAILQFGYLYPSVWAACGETREERITCFSKSPIGEIERESGGWLTDSQSGPAPGSSGSDPKHSADFYW